MVNMAAARIARSQQARDAIPPALPAARSSLVRRLVAAENDPAKQRIRALLANLGNERLSGLGLTPQDILILRGTQEQHHPATGSNAGIASCATDRGSAAKTQGACFRDNSGSFQRT